MTKGGAIINIQKKEVSPTIRAQMGGHPPLVMETYERKDDTYENTNDTHKEIFKCDDKRK